MLRYILFDLDGTLTDSKEGIVKSIRYALEKMGEAVPAEEVLTLFVGPPLTDSLMRYCGMDRERADLALQLFRERYAREGLFENRAVPGMPELLKKLKEEGFLLALASSKPEAHCGPILERFGFAPYLDVVAGSEGSSDEGKADIIRKVLDRLKLTEADKPSMLMVGDRKYDVLGAKDCGIACVGITCCGYAEPGELEAAGVTAVFQTVAELESYLMAQRT